jgi:hypothetical protein
LALTNTTAAVGWNSSRNLASFEPFGFALKPFPTMTAQYKQTTLPGF